MIARSEGAITWSADEGRTWTPPQKFAMRMFEPGLIVLRDGTLLCIHGSYVARGQRAIFSTDGGQTWIAPAKDFGFAIDSTVYGYGRGIELPDGSVFVAYIHATAGTKHATQKLEAIWGIRLRIIRARSQRLGSAAAAKPQIRTMRTPEVCRRYQREARELATILSAAAGEAHRCYSQTSAFKVRRRCRAKNWQHIRCPVTGKLISTLTRASMPAAATSPPTVIVPGRLAALTSVRQSPMERFALCPRHVRLVARRGSPLAVPAEAFQRIPTTENVIGQSARQ